MKKRYIVFTVLGLILAVLIVYRLTVSKEGDAGGKGQGPKGGGPGGAGAPVPVKAIVVTPRSFSNSLSVTGSVEPNEEIQLRSEVSGIVTRIYFTEGAYVKKGQTLLKINDSELQAQLSEALTKQKLAAQTEYRSRMLLEKEAISKEEYDIALADLRSFQSQTQLIRAQIARTYVYAPFSGKIGLRSISPGSYLTPTTVVASLVSTNPIKIIFSVPEKYSSQIRQNGKISFTVSGSSKKYEAAIYAIEPNINMTSRTLEIAARADNTSGELLPGAFAKIELPLSVIPDAILVPTEAVIPVEKGKKVFVSNNGIAREVMIETSTRTDKEVLVTSGLKPGDTVLTTGMMSLKAESPIKVSVPKK